MKTNPKDLLTSYMDALFPIIYINHFDFKVIDDILKDITKGKNVIEYHDGLGILNFKTKALEKECDLVTFLKLSRDDGYDDETVILLKDVHSQLDNPEVMSELKYIAERHLNSDDYSTTVFIVSSKLKVPEELEHLITVYDYPFPDDTEIRRIITNFANELEITLEEAALNELALSFKGLNEFQINQILNLAYQDGGCLDFEDKQLILSQKEQYVKKAGLLEMMPIKESIEDIGGLENLKTWLQRKERIFNQLGKAVKFGVDIPKGIMIVGMPGCGKSLVAKATAKLFEIPLVRLDVGRLMGKYVGESEGNLRKALKLAEAISPCGLWIDEIEKAFAGVKGGGGGSEVTTRLFGQFLTWMQEKENTVFIVATANDISNMPPEFLRKGRFDEIFFVDLPNKGERQKILEIHLKKRNKWNDGINSAQLAQKTDGYSGADLESVVKETIESAFIDGKDKISTEDLQHIISDTKSISDTLKDGIKRIKETVQKLDIKAASKSDAK